MSRSVVNDPIEGTHAANYEKPKGRGRRKPTLLPEGKVYGRLTATAQFEFRERRDGRNRAFQKFVCECGNTVWVIPSVVKTGSTQSCGCLHTETVKAQKVLVTRTRNGVQQVFTRDRNHGQSRTRLYRKWKSMHARCSNPNSKVWKWYGGKGIRVVDEWSDWETFQQWALSSGYQDGLELDRIDADAHYGPDNCRWITKRENIKRARAALPPEVGLMLVKDAQTLGKSPETLITEIVTAYYVTPEEAQAVSASRKPKGSVTDGKEV